MPHLRQGDGFPKCCPDLSPSVLRDVPRPPGCTGVLFLLQVASLSFLPSSASPDSSKRVSPSLLGALQARQAEGRLPSACPRPRATYVPELEPAPTAAGLHPLLGPAGIGADSHRASEPSSSGEDTKRTLESCPQPVLAVTPLSPILADARLTPPPAAHTAFSITNNVEATCDVDPMPRTPRTAGVFLGRFEVLWSSPCPVASVAPAQLKVGSAQPHHGLHRDAARNTAA